MSELEQAYADAGRAFTEASKLYRQACDMAALVVEAHGADSPKDLLIESQAKIKAARAATRKAEAAYLAAGAALYGDKA